ncbi:hypothetical protein GCM10010304_83610 [Streptomyces roseoviolaceus]
MQELYDEQGRPHRTRPGDLKISYGTCVTTLCTVSPGTALGWLVPDYPSDVFFPGAAVQEGHGAKWDSLNPVGVHVVFEVDEHGKGDRPRANYVSPISVDE